jgi:hypothetical protein
VIVTNTRAKGAGGLSTAALAAVSGSVEVARTSATVVENVECVQRFLHWVRVHRIFTFLCRNRFIEVQFFCTKICQKFRKSIEINDLAPQDSE